jgi:hypothetical protein
MTFFEVRLITSTEVKTLLLFKRFIIMQLCRVKYIKYLRTRKCDFECEWNLSLVLFFLAIFIRYFYCLDTAVLAHPFWALAEFLYSQRSKLNFLMIQAVLNWGMAGESWVTIPAREATIMTANMSSLFCQLCCTGSKWWHFCSSKVLDDLYNTFWQKM